MLLTHIKPSKPRKGIDPLDIDVLHTVRGEWGGRGGEVNWSRCYGEVFAMLLCQYY